MKTVKDIRIQSGLTLTELAQYLGISRWTLLRAERGGYTLSTVVLLRLARVDACLQDERKASILPVTNECYMTRLQMTMKQLSSLQDQLSDLEKTGDQNRRICNLLFSLEQQADEEWKKWYEKTSAMLTAIQNNNGSWNGHHCITSPVFCTATCLLVLSIQNDIDKLTALGSTKAK